MIIEIIIGIILGIIFWYFMSQHKIKQENFDVSQINNEALQTIASIYNADNFAVTNMTVSGRFNQLPRGIIVAWYGSEIPMGWVLCNGQNGTPDLRNKFIYGNDSATARPEIAGSPTATLTVANMPRHNHGGLTGTTNPMSGKMCTGGGRENRTLFDVADNKGTNYDCSPDLNHDHTIPFEGEGRPFSILPSYVKLAYIMKL